MIAHIAWPRVTLATLAAELDREAQQRRRFYPGRVDQGRMLQAEADAQLALVSAWSQDVARMKARWVDQQRDLPPLPHGLTWHHRHGGLLRELAYRERFYPDWIRDGRLLEGEAAHRIACLQCLLEIYEDGWDWQATNGRRGNTVLAVNDRDERLAAEEFAALQAAKHARNGTAQKELSL